MSAPLIRIAVIIRVFERFGIFRKQFPRNSLPNGCVQAARQILYKLNFDSKVYVINDNTEDNHGSSQCREPDGR
jgi:hypothetical protein